MNVWEYTQGKLEELAERLGNDKEYSALEFISDCHKLVAKALVTPVGLEHGRDAEYIEACLEDVFSENCMVNFFTRPKSGGNFCEYVVKYPESAKAKMDVYIASLPD